MTTHNKQPKTILSFDANALPRRKPYRTPRLEALGDLRSLTLGGSIGSGESGNPVRKVGFGLPQPADGIVMPDGSRLMPDGSLLPPNR